MFYVMQLSSANVGGFERLAVTDSEADAQRLAKARDTRINGKRSHDTQVWNEARYNDWHTREIMPFYR